MGNVWPGEDLGEHDLCLQRAEESSSRRGFKLSQGPKGAIMDDTVRQFKTIKGKASKRKKGSKRFWK